MENCHFSPRFPACRAVKQTILYISILAQSRGCVARLAFETACFSCEVGEALETLRSKELVDQEAVWCILCELAY